MMNSRGTLVFLVILMCVASLAQAKDVRKDYDETFTVQPGMTLRLAHGDGQVTVMPTDEDALSVKIRYRGNHTRIGVGDRMDFEADFDQHGDVIEVTGREKGSFIIGFSTISDYEYTYTITAPSYLILEFEGDDGDVSITGWQGNITCDLDDGDVGLENVHADLVEVDLEDGDLNITDLSGQLDIRVDDGDIDLTGIDSDDCSIEMADGRLNISRSTGVFDLEAEDGDIEIRRTRASSVSALVEDGDIVVDLDGTGSVDLDLESSDGDIRVTLADGLTAEYDIVTDDGRIKLGLPDDAIDINRKHHASGQLGTGDGTIRIQTGDGAVHFKANGLPIRLVDDE